MTKHRSMALIILDGFGERSEREHNAIRLADTPNLEYLFKYYPHTFLNASGESVGLPDGQIGNSEVGHLHIGAGRKVPQDLTRIDHAIETGDFFANPILDAAIKKAKKTDAAVHIIGLLSSGGVHSRDNQISAMIEMVERAGINKNYCHAILDGRDTPPKSASRSLKKIACQYEQYGHGQIATLCGRYFAMDRDQRWDRIEKAYDLYTQGVAKHHAATPIEGLEYAYYQGETDEFVAPIVIGEQAITIQDGDVVIFMNFRADRARQLTIALTDSNFHSFNRKFIPKLGDCVTLTQYASNLNVGVAFPSLQLKNTLGEFVSHHGLKQLRIAETEKYAHVTYFLNGGNETPFKNEERNLIPSPKVTTYDLKPAMSAREMTAQLCKQIQSQQFDLIVCNYANPDMVGHTGNETAAREAIEVVDQCIKEVLEAIKAVDGEMLITADHGNAELMFDKNTQQPYTAHTTNLVPLIYVGRPASFAYQDGALDDIAPTLLYLINLPQPQEMTGRNLIQLQ